jgi:hypothetical protein
MLHYKRNPESNQNSFLRQKFESCRSIGTDLSAEQLSPAPKGVEVVDPDFWHF